MNAQTAPLTRNPSPVVVPFETSARLVRRERDFGVGYGKSSGYATTRRYAAPSTAPRFFRFA
ncbi:MAG: hypothetical protein ACOY37_00770 [Pseudomonadota bacterium]